VRDEQHPPANAPTAKPQHAVSRNSLLDVFRFMVVSLYISNIAVLTD